MRGNIATLADSLLLWKRKDLKTGLCMRSSNECAPHQTHMAVMLGTISLVID